MCFKKVLSATALGLMIPGSCFAMEDSYYKKQTELIEVEIEDSVMVCEKEYGGNMRAMEEFEKLGCSIGDENIGYFNDSKVAVCTQGWHNKALVFFSEYTDSSRKTAKIDYIINISNLSLDDLILAVMQKFENESGYDSVIINTKDIKSCDPGLIKELGFKDSGDIFEWHKPAKK